MGFLETYVGKIQFFFLVAHCEGVVAGRTTMREAKLVTMLSSLVSKPRATMNNCDK